MTAHGIGPGSTSSTPAPRPSAAPYAADRPGPVGEAGAGVPEPLKAAKRRLYAALIASAHRLDEPFTDRPELSPWELIKQRMKALDEAIAEAFGGKTS